MTTIPVRDLGALGIIRDVNPSDLPVNAFSDGMNVRFDTNKVQRAPVLRTVSDTLTGTTPVFCHGLFASGGSFDQVLYANNDGRLFTVANGTETEVTETGHVNNVDTRNYTACALAQNTYINRPDAVPRYLGPTATAFAALPNWDSTWRCNSLRSYKSYLFAINVTKGATTYPNMVKWSDAVTANSPPDSWDATDTTKLAGENLIQQLRTPLVDGGQLGENFVIYSYDDVWLVQEIGGEFIFEWRRLPFDNAGTLNQNCWIEIDGKHYAWGETDIYVHDGVEKKSIIDQRNRETFFRELNMKRSNVFFIAHDKYRHEIIFCGVSGSANAAWPNPNGYCNYGAVYNYVRDTWSFIDLPNVSSATVANVNTVWTYGTVSSAITYATIGGSYFDQDDSYSRYCVVTSVQDTTNGLLASKIHVFDGADQSKVALAIDADTVKTAWVQRTGLDFDNVGAPLRSYKTVNYVMPLVRVYAPAVTVTVQMGGHNASGQNVTWGASQTFDPSAQYKIDVRGGGRFLAYEFSMTTANDFDVSGFDADVAVTGRR